MAQQSTASYLKMTVLVKKVLALIDEFEAAASEGFMREAATPVLLGGVSLTDKVNSAIDKGRARLVELTETTKLQQEAIDELSKGKDELNTLRDLSSAIGLAQTRDEIVQLLINMIREKILPIGGAALYQGSEDLGFTLSETWETTPEDLAEIDRQKTSGFLQWAMKSPVPISMPSEGRYPTAVYVPMRVGNQTLGILLLLSSRAVDEFTQSDHDRMTLLCSQAAIALENARLVTQILQMKQYNESILLSLTSGLLAVDLDGRVTTLNPAGLTILNYQAGDILGMKVSDLPPLAEFARLLTEAVTSSMDRRNVEIQIDRGERNKQVLGVSVSPVLAEGDRVIGAMGIFVDLTAIKVLEQQVRRNDRLAVVGQLAAGAAHEIRNPLSAIRGNIQLLNRKLQKLAEPDALLVKTKSIIEEVDRINRIVAGMMDMSKEGSLQLVRTPVGKFLRDVGYIVEGNFKEAQVGLDFVLDETLPEVEVDLHEMKQVFLNLYQNALQAMKANGKLTVTSERIKEEDGREMIQVKVADTGCGIDQKHLEKVFAPFFTTKTDGTGLGLSIVHRIVQEHKGDITVESEIGKGTTFIVRLPQAPPAAGATV